MYAPRQRQIPGTENGSKFGPVPLDIRALFAAVVAVHVVATQGAEAPTPQWIWASGSRGSSSTGTVWFRRTFQTPPFTWNARLTVVADDQADVFLNGHPVAACRQPGEPIRAEVSMRLNQGNNVLAVRARNESGPAGLLVHLNLGGAETRQIVTDTNWVTTTEEQPGWNTFGFRDASWSPAARRGPHGMPPWGDVLARATATPAESLKLLPGFEAELLRSAAPGEGSWVCMTFDGRGRLYVSPEGDSHPLLRFTVNADGRLSSPEAVPAPIRFAMGLLFADGTLYANARGPSGTGLYRLTDTNGNDRFDEGELRLLKRFQGAGEHGYHGLALGPEGWIYVVNGNGTHPPEGLSATSPYRHFAEDVLSLNPDETTRPGGALVPGCTVLRTDPRGRRWEIFAGGMRNAYGLDFNPDGELFVFDSDNEWDWGTPWYRPTRLYHCVSGSEMGWRDGTRAWPDGYPEMNPGILDVGIGSPCGVKFGTHARFPERYRRAIYLQDWSYGRILAVHLTPDGSTYRATQEEFVRGQPLNLTSLAFGPDGAMYFITGGRGTQSGLYRIRYTNVLDEIQATEPLTSTDSAARQARAVRHDLEAFHTQSDPTAVAQLWPHLDDPDPAIRQAARIALEAQDVSSWRDRAVDETVASRALPALLALTRVDGSPVHPALFRALTRFPLADLPADERILKIRVVELSLLHHGRPNLDAGSAAAVIDELDATYPSAVWPENRELCRILLSCNRPGAVSRTLLLLEQAPGQEEQIHYLAQLRSVRTQWKPEERRRYFRWWLQPRDHLPHSRSILAWFQEVGRDYVDGASLDRHLAGFRHDAEAALDPTQRAALRDLLDAPMAGAQFVPRPPRPFVREWTVAELLPDLDQTEHGRDFERGRQAFLDAQCTGCHRFGDRGGATGPELTGVGQRYAVRDILQSIVDPSNVVSDQYQNMRVTLKDGDDVTGRLVRQSDTEVVIETDPLNPTEQTVRRSAIDDLRPSTVSPMPEGLVNTLSRDEILDLLAYLVSGGRQDAPAFQRQGTRTSGGGTTDPRPAQ